ncbi:MAG: sigma-54-dependent Fis family transcriptional regulator [Bacteroidales bacterium]|nr:sigma-54-dependent Fis family transcriptional regulator [Candidatus Sodaliphilus aphodohippi]
MPTQEELIKSVKRQHNIIGNSTALNEAIGRALRVAPIDLSVLITGESGTGKENMSRILHENSPRKHKKFIAVNCGAIPEGTIDSELFGHVKGAFTGAVDNHDGYFKVADGGTIFLDEIGEMPLETQARLLRVLENGEFIKVGSSKVEKTNIRVVAATNKDLLKAISDGKFREDLYYRLSTVQIHIPPLRERDRDIELLVLYFANSFARTHMMPKVEFAPDAISAMQGYRWPGNIRQLKNVVEQVALFEAGNTVTSHVLRDYLPNMGGTNLPVAVENAGYDYNRERELLFHLILQLQQDVAVLKQQAMGTYTGTGDRGTIATPEVGDLHRALDTQILPEQPALTTIEPNIVTDATPAPEIYGNVIDAHEVKSLDETRREAIIDALRRNKNSRRKAAQDLGISERTLYRKIKEYNLQYT